MSLIFRLVNFKHHFTNTFYFMNVDTEFSRFFERPVVRATDHSESAGVHPVAFRKGDVHGEPCDHYLCTIHPYCSRDRQSHTTDTDQTEELGFCGLSSYVPRYV